MSRIYLCSDPHLDIAKDVVVDNFAFSIELLRITTPIFVLGDVSHSNMFQKYIHRLGDVRFIHGNHDFYGSTFDDVRYRDSKNYMWLENAPFVLNNDTLVVGVDGNADGIGGDVDFPLSDFTEIRDYHLRNRRLDTMLYWSHKSVDVFMKNVDNMRMYKKVVILTHVPPFDELCYYDGRQQSKEYLPYFCNRPLGNAIRSVVDDMPSTEFYLFCGHTHHSAIYDYNNLHGVTIGAKYGDPKVVYFDI